jgi:hypothetical protein
LQTQIALPEYLMKKSTIVVSLILVLAGLILTGTILLRLHDLALARQVTEQVHRQIDAKQMQDLKYEAQERREIAARINKGIEQGIGAYTERFKRQEAQRMADDKIDRSNVEKLIISDQDFYASDRCTVPINMLTERNRIRSNNGK